MSRRSGIAMIGAIALLIGSCSFEERTDREAAPEVSVRKQIIQPEGVARLPVFSSAVRSGDFIFLSGALGALPGVNPPQLVDGGIVPETHQTMENIVNVLGAAGATLDDVVKCTVFLADIADYAAMNEVYLEYFPADPPARSALAGGGLALGAQIGRAHV